MEERLLNIARDLRPLKSDGDHFIVSFAVKQGRILRIGVNSYKQTDTYNKDYVSPRNGDIAPFRHAESNLIKKLQYTDTSKINLYVVRVSKRGEARLAKPCINCSRLLGKNKFKNVYYSLNAG